jgi:energy-coupling factor transporter transmembrane protein EcfT
MIPYTYISGNTILHRAPAPIKLLGLILISAAAFFAFPFGLVAASSLVLCASFLARTRVRHLFRGSLGLLLLSVLTVVSRSVSFSATSNTISFTMDGFLKGISYGLGLLVSFAACALFFLCTTMTELKDSLDSLARHIPFLGLKKLSLCLSLMLGFLPRFFEKWEEADIAYQARAGKNGVRKVLLLIPLTIERMLELALETASALEMRGIIH